MIAKFSRLILLGSCLFAESIYANFGYYDQYDPAEVTGPDKTWFILIAAFIVVLLLVKFGTKRNKD